MPSDGRISHQAQWPVPLIPALGTQRPAWSVAWALGQPRRTIQRIPVSKKKPKTINKKNKQKNPSNFQHTAEAQNIFSFSVGILW